MGPRSKKPVREAERQGAGGGLPAQATSRAAAVGRAKSHWSSEKREKQWRGDEKVGSALKLGSKFTLRVASD